jgi:hypothetical protein
MGDWTPYLRGENRQGCRHHVLTCYLNNLTNAGFGARWIFVHVACVSGYWGQTNVWDEKLVLLNAL